MEARINRLDTPERANEEPGRDQQHNRNRNFRNDECRAKPLMAPTDASAGTFTQSCVVGSGTHAERGENPKQQSRTQRNHCSKAEYSRIKNGCIADRQGGRNQHRQQRQRHRRDHNSSNATAEGEDEAFGQQLAHQPFPSGTNRGAHREFLAARHASREQKTCQIRAGNQ